MQRRRNFMEHDSNNVVDAFALIADLERSEKPIIRAAVDALISLTERSAELRSALHLKLSDPHVKNRWTIAYVLAHLPHPPSDVVHCLLDGLDHKEADIRWAIGLLLVRLARTNPSIAQELLRRCTDGSPLQRRMAVYCVRDLNLQDAASEEVLFLALRDPDPMVRMAAVAGLKRRNLDSSNKDVLLAIFLEDSDNRVRSVAAVTLAQIGAPSERFLSELKLAEMSDDEQIRRAAKAALSLLEK